MSDIKLFRRVSSSFQQLTATSVAIEKSLQTLIEQNCETLLGVRFLASEYSTGKTHGGRIDTLCLDENAYPVIIEYKRALNENVINQGLYYLDWLMDHKAEFRWLVLERLGKDLADSIEWSSPRLLCIANDFTKFDGHAVQQINRNIELLRYRRYGDDLLLLELVNAAIAQGPIGEPVDGGKKPGRHKAVTDYLGQASTDQRDRFDALKAMLFALGDDIQMKTLKNYFAFKRLQNFACVEVRADGRIVIYAKVDPTTVPLEEGFTRDVRAVGHFGTGDLEITLLNDADLARAQPLLESSYENS